MLSWGGNFGKAVSAIKSSNVNERLAHSLLCGNQICQKQKRLGEKQLI